MANQAKEKPFLTRSRRGRPTTCFDDCYSRMWADQLRRMVAELGLVHLLEIRGSASFRRRRWESDVVRVQAHGPILTLELIDFCPVTLRTRRLQSPVAQCNGCVAGQHLDLIDWCDEALRRDLGEKLFV
jgi:hypothetical protein